MWVLDVRMPPQPAVPVVARSDAQAMTTTTDRTPPEYRWARYARARRDPARRRRGDAAWLTQDDLDLVHAVTGETIWPGEEPADLSAFARQIARDRRTGTLSRGRPVDALYLLRVGRTIDAMGAPENPFGGYLLMRALDHLQRCGLGGVDVGM